jgi:hypothetical protein
VPVMVVVGVLRIVAFAQMGHRGSRLT